MNIVYSTCTIPVRSGKDDPYQFFPIRVGCSIKKQVYRGSRTMYLSFSGKGKVTSPAPDPTASSGRSARPRRRSCRETPPVSPLAGTGPMGAPASRVRH